MVSGNGTSWERSQGCGLWLRYALRPAGRGQRRRRVAGVRSQDSFAVPGKPARGVNGTQATQPNQTSEYDCAEGEAKENEACVNHAGLGNRLALRGEETGQLRRDVRSRLGPLGHREQEHA